MQHRSLDSRSAGGTVTRLIGGALVALAVALMGPLSATAGSNCSYADLVELIGFYNPGKLKAYAYVPQGLPAGAPLVVALHGCGEKACDYDNEVAWTGLADAMRFAVLFPEQPRLNFISLWPTGNIANCFNWADSAGNRLFGEPRSIMEMTRHMVKRFNLDPRRVFVTGISGGGAMTNVMLAQFPDCFAGGAPVAGSPYGCAGHASSMQTDVTSNAIAIGEACMCMTGTASHAACAQMQDPVNVTPQQRGDAVRKVTCTSNPLFGNGELCPDTAPGGKWPKVSIWHGANDPMVAPVNLIRQMQQWTNVHHLDPNAGVVDANPGTATDPYSVVHTTYADKNGEVQVETYLVKSSQPFDASPGTGHVQVVDAKGGCGCVSVDCACEQNPTAPCSAVASTRDVKDVGICASKRIATFWGIDKPAAPSTKPVCAPLR
jgi:poly(hydroxyalkanoate) depolymerase family esterase